MKKGASVGIPALAAAMLLPAVALGAGGSAAAQTLQQLQQESNWVRAAATQVQLDAGEVPVQSNFNAAQARVSVDAAIRIHASPQSIWPLITQCDSASILIPGLRHCKELSSAADGSWAIVEHDIKFAVMLPMVHSVFRADYHAPYRMEFHRIAGDMKDEVGTWVLQPSADGRSTTIEYRVAMQPGFFVPHSMIRRSLKKQLPAALLALRARAERPDAHVPLAAAATPEGSDAPGGAPAQSQPQ